MKTALTIAGSDSSGGAGIQADIKTMTMNGVYAMSAILALTAQNTLGVKGIYNVSKEFLELQIDTIFEDIIPDAVKIGMVSNKDLIEVIVDRLNKYQAKNIVIDPVMVSTSGDILLETNAVETLKNKLLPLARLITPNIPEAEVLSGMKITDENTMLLAGKKIFKDLKVAVLIKGGHNINDANDLLIYESGVEKFYGRRINTENTHGTGCTLSSAIASNLAKGYSLVEAIKKAKDYISGALEAGLDLGRGSGPMKHSYNLSGDFLN